MSGLKIIVPQAKAFSPALIRTASLEEFENSLAGAPGAKTFKNPLGSNLAHLAAQAGRDDILLSLIQRHGVPGGAQTRAGKTVLHMLATLATPEVITRAVLAADADAAERRMRDGQNPWHTAAAARSLPALHALSATDVPGADAVTYAGSSPLHMAVTSTSRKGDSLPAVVSFLLALGVVPDRADEDKQTPLHYAACDGDLAVSQLLIDAGADVSAENAIRWTALHFAANNGHAATAAALVAAGARLTSDKKGWTPLHCAAFGPAGAEVISAIASASGADLAARNNDGQTALALAARAGHADAVRVLGRCGADMSAEEPLLAREAFYDGAAGVLAALVEGGAPCGDVAIEPAVELLREAGFSAAADKLEDLMQ